MWVVGGKKFISDSILIHSLVVRGMQVKLKLNNNEIIKLIKLTKI